MDQTQTPRPAPSEPDAQTHIAEDQVQLLQTLRTALSEVEHDVAHDEVLYA